MKPIAAAVLLVLLACTAEKPPSPASTPTAPQMPVQTDRPRYALREGPFGPETTIVTTFTAPADKPVYLVNCNGAFSMSLQRQVGNTWVHAWGAELNACLSEPIVIGPGQRHSGTMTAASGVDALVSSRRTESHIPQGTYRAVWNGLYTSFDPRASPWGEELPLEQRVSAPFIIDEAPPHDPTRTSPAEQPAEITSVEPAHGAQVAADAPVRVVFAPGFRFNGVPYLYVDGEWIDRDLSLPYVPPRGWTPGLHEVRVIYQDDQKRTRWYAWSFTAAAR